MDASSNTSPLDDTDSIWGANDEVTTQEWSKMDEDFTNAGYREGITAGKESALQEGFDEGFATVGAPLGRDMGVLRGLATAIMTFLSASENHVGSPEAVERWSEEVRNIVGDLDGIHLADIAPRDLQAEEHAREHLENDPTLQIAAGGDAKGGDPSRILEHRLEPTQGEQSVPSPAVQELKRLRMRLSNVLEELGLDVPLV